MILYCIFYVKWTPLFLSPASHTMSGTFVVDRLKIFQACPPHFSSAAHLQCATRQVVFFCSTPSSDVIYYSLVVKWPLEQKMLWKYQHHLMIFLSLTQAIEGKIFPLKKFRTFFEIFFFQNRAIIWIIWYIITWPTFQTRYLRHKKWPKNS